MRDTTNEQKCLNNSRADSQQGEKNEQLRGSNTKSLTIPLQNLDDLKRMLNMNTKKSNKTFAKNVTYIVKASCETTSKTKNDLQTIENA